MKWNKTAERLPEKSGYYLCISEADDGTVSRFASVLHFSVMHGKFNTQDFYDYDLAEHLGISVAYWMELPDYPEEGDWY